MNPNNHKFEITDIAHPEYPFLHRIRALRDIGPTVKAGDLGGFVEHEGNLSYEDRDSWIAHVSTPSRKCRFSPKWNVIFRRSA